MIPSVPFQDAPPVREPVLAPELIDGGPVAMMHRDLQARLAQAFPPAQFTHRTMPSRMTPEAFARFTERVPVIGLGWVKMTPVAGLSVRPRIWSGRAHWQLWVVVRNKTPEAQLLGDRLPAGFGMAGLIAVATAALHGRPIAGIGAAQVGEAGQAYSESWANAELAMAAIEVTVPFDLVDVAGLQRLDEFLRMGVRWPGYPDVVADMRDDEGEAA